MKKEKLDEFHLHELVDRLHCIRMMYEDMIVNHPAAALIIDDVNKVGNKLTKLYLLAGETSSKMFD